MTRVTRALALTVGLLALGGFAANGGIERNGMALTLARQVDRVAASEPGLWRKCSELPGQNVMSPEDQMVTRELWTSLPVSVGTTDTDAAILVSLLQLTEGDTANAVETLAGVRRDRPGDRTANWYLGLFAACSGRRADAIRYWTEGRLAPYLTYFARRALQDGHEEAALQLYRLALEVDPLTPGANLELARLLNGRAEWPDAVNLYQAALRAGDDPLEANLSLGSILMERLNDPGAALVHFRVAAALAPHYVWPILRIGDAYQALGQPAEALRSYADAGRVDPDSAWPSIRIGEVFLSQGKPSEALEAFRNATRKEPDNAAALRGLGLSQLDTGEILASLRSLEQARQLAPDDPWTLRALARVEARQGDCSGARRDYTAAIRLRPEFAREPVPVDILQTGCHITVGDRR